MPLFQALSSIFCFPRKVDSPEGVETESNMDGEKEVNKSQIFPEMDPSQDPVYQKTTSVVKSIVELNTGVQIARPDEFVDLVKVCQTSLAFTHILHATLTVELGRYFDQIIL